jgi:hypothetical protein
MKRSPIQRFIMKKFILLSLISLMFSGTAFAADTDEPTTTTEVTIVGDAGDAGDDGGDTADEAAVDPNHRRRLRPTGFVLDLDGPTGTNP